jgi:ubiquinone/menaquinone biosynthesis C-methylase UbiE
MNERHDRIQALGYDYSAQAKAYVEHCNLCGGSYFVQISDRDRYGYKAGAFACGRCGLVFINPRMTQDAYNNFYATTYRPLVSAYHGRVIDAKSIQGEQAEYAVDRADFVSEFLPAQNAGTLLDIGGSTGVVARHFAERFGYRGVVLDPSEDELREAKAHGLETIQGFFETANFEGKQFDLILLCQTIDHLLDIALTLEKVRACTKPNGFFFVDIVDFRAAYLRHWRVAEALKVDHPYYLTESTAEAFLRRSGFAILRKGYAHDHLHVSYLCQPTKPEPGYLPDTADVRSLLREIRTVQNAPRGALA